MAQEMGKELGFGNLLLQSLPPRKAYKMSSVAQCVWFKRDLRVIDHRPLNEAAERGPVLAIYIIEPAVIYAHDFDALHWDFIRESLSELRDSLRQLGTELQVVYGDAELVFSDLHESHGIRRILAHEETGNAITYVRDVAVSKWAAARTIEFVEFPQNGVVRRLRGRDGWARQWESRMAQPIIDVPQQLTSVEGLEPCEIPTSRALHLTESTRERDLTGGETAGIRALESFTSTRGHRYHREMSSPNTAYESCSRLSPYLAWGCLSMRSVVQAIRMAAGDSMPKIAARAFLSRCHWHCHFMQKLESEPEIEFRAFNPACDRLRPKEPDIKRLLAWKEGQTGYPFVDACIRSLKARGWINFRMRAMLVSFASYHLWLDWRSFKDWLACQFIDYEPGIHISQVQMQSGLTGINTLRIYNPIKQGQDHDSEGQFIRRWVPELAQVATTDIHEPWKMPELMQMESSCRIGRDYPLPIVDHKEAITFARSKFAELRKRDDYWEASRVVLERHGSRKSRESRNRPTRPKRGSSQIEMNLDESEN